MRTWLLNITRLSMSFFADERAVASIEYALLAAGIGTAVMIGAQDVGNDLQGIFRGLEHELRVAAR